MREIGSQQDIAGALVNIPNLLTDRGDLDAAEKNNEEALTSPPSFISKAISRERSECMSAERHGTPELFGTFFPSKLASCAYDRDCAHWSTLLAVSLIQVHAGPLQPLTQR
jgi:hypothetical protein